MWEWFGALEFPTMVGQAVAVAQRPGVLMNMSLTRDLLFYKPDTEGYLGMTTHPFLPSSMAERHTNLDIQLD